MQISKKISAIIKLLIVGFTFWFLYQKVFADESINETKRQFINLLERQNYFDLLFVFVLMFVNWSIDAIKWKFLISKIEKVSFWVSLKAVFLGITVSMFTPNRVGEFGGRVFCLKKADRIKAVLITIFGNVNQLVTTLIFGLLAIVFFSTQYTMPLFKEFFSNTMLLLFLTIFIIILLITFLLNSSRFLKLVSKLKPLRKYTEYTHVLNYFSRQEIFYVLFLSISRYFVYSFQFFILLKFVGIELALIDSLIMISLTFFSMSVIPSIALTEIGVRGSVSVFFFSFISGNTIGILTAAFSLWFINLVIPAIIGTLFVYQLKFFRS